MKRRQTCMNRNTTEPDSDVVIYREVKYHTAPPDSSAVGTTVSTVSIIEISSVKVRQKVVVDHQTSYTLERRNHYVRLHSICIRRTPAYAILKRIYSQICIYIISIDICIYQGHIYLSQRPDSSQK